MAVQIKAEFDDKEVRELLAKLRKKVDAIGGDDRGFAALVGAKVFEDIVSHFEEEMGSEGRWAPWSDTYRERMTAKGKGGNNILQDTGTLRQGFVPTNVKKQKDGIAFFNPVPYANRHDKGDASIGLPKRDFMYLSDEGFDTLERVTLAYLLDEDT